MSSLRKYALRGPLHELDGFSRRGFGTRIDVDLGRLLTETRLREHPRARELEAMPLGSRKHAVFERVLV